MTGKEYAGSRGGRRAILAALDRLGLEVPTTELPHRIEGLLSIDHIALGHGFGTSAARLVGERGVTQPSDHDAYVVGDEPFVGMEFDSKTAKDYAAGS